VRRICAGNEANLSQRQAFLQFEGRTKVSIVNRIESAAEDTDWAHA
jgi:hypothetical protein